MLHCKSHYHSVVEKHQRAGSGQCGSCVTGLGRAGEMRPECRDQPRSIMSRVWRLQRVCAGQQLIHHTLQTPDTSTAVLQSATADNPGSILTLLQRPEYRDYYYHSADKRRCEEAAYFISVTKLW